jgi:hypothetical protein
VKVGRTPDLITDVEGSPSKVVVDRCTEANSAEHDSRAQAHGTEFKIGQSKHDNPPALVKAGQQPPWVRNSGIYLPKPMYDDFTTLVRQPMAGQRQRQARRSPFQAGQPGTKQSRR